METTDDDVFFLNRCRALFIVNVLADNNGYAKYVRSKGFSGVRIADTIDLFKNVFGECDDIEIVRTIDQLVREGLLTSMGGDAVMNPNPPISVDSEGIEIKIEAVGHEDVKTPAP